MSTAVRATGGRGHRGRRAAPQRPQPVELAAARRRSCVPLLVPLYNQVEPTLFGWPRFYWLQLAFVGARRGHARRSSTG